MSFVNLIVLSCLEMLEVAFGETTCRKLYLDVALPMITKYCKSIKSTRIYIN